jgi:hypothetical protein
MPAVQLERLKTEISGLAWQFTNPEEFHRGLHNLLDNYSNRGYRAGREIKKVKFIQVYHVPPLVLSQIELEMSRLCRENPGAALLLVDELWKDDHLETRQLASYILGQIPLSPLDNVLQRLNDWCKPEEEMLSLEMLLQKGSWRLRREKPEVWLSMISNWLEHPEASYQKMGLQALLPLVQDHEFENLPPIFRLIQTFMYVEKPYLVTDLQEVIVALDRRTTGETVYFLRQIIYLHPEPEVMRLMRRLLPLLSADAQAILRGVIKQFS